MKLFDLVRVVCFSLLIPFNSDAQSSRGYEKWTSEVRNKGSGKHDLVFHVKIEKGWHLFYYKSGEGMSELPGITFKKNEDVVLDGELERYSVKGSTSGKGEVDEYEYIQKIKVKRKTNVRAEVAYQLNQRDMCTAPIRVNFEFDVVE